MAITIYKYAYHVGWGSTGIAVSSRSGGGAPVDLSNYYTIQQLQTPNLSSVNFANITDAYHNQMLGLQGGKVVTDSSGTPSSEGDDEFYHLDAETYSRVITWEFLDSLIEESDGTIHLVNDEDDPGLLKYYGTDINGIKGWFDLPEENSSDIIPNYVFDMSLVEDSTGIVTLLNDSDSPGNLKLYGTDASGVKGWYDQASLSGFVSVSGTPVNNQIAIWTDSDTIEGSTELSYDGRTFIFGGYPIDIPDAGQTNLAIGSILNDYDSAEYNVFIGVDAGKVTKSDGYNVAIGYGAYASSIGGVANVAIGYMSLYSNLGDFQASGVEGIWNTAVGAETLFSNTIGGYNTAIGASALYNNIEHHDNTAIGCFALEQLSGGDDNVAVGYDALGASIDGNRNIGIGAYANGPLHGNENVMIGYYAGCGGTTLDNVNGVITIGTRAAFTSFTMDLPLNNVTDGIFIGRDVKPLVDNSVNEIVIGANAIGNGSNTTTIGSYDTIATYLQGEIYFIDTDSAGDDIGSLPLADSSITQVVMYDPTSGKLYYGAGEGGSVSYAFAMSLAESAGTVTLDNDEASPGNSKYYGTNGSGTKGWYDLPSGGSSAVDSTLLDWSTDRYQPYTTQQSGGEFYTDQNTIPDEVDYLGYNGTLGVYSLCSVMGLHVGLSTSGIASTSWHVNMFGLTETYLASDVRCRFNPAVESYLDYDAYMFDTGGTLASDQWLSVWKHDGDIVASLDGDGKLYSNTFIYKYVIGDSSLISHYSEQTTTSESYTKLKTITLGSNIGINTILRIRFDLKLDPVGSPPWAYGRIYRNGIAVGTERQTGSSSYITYSEDITDWNAGDTVELWVRTHDSGYTAYVQDFTICGSHNSIANEVTGTTS